MQGVQVIIKGKVHGVGYRVSAKKMANQLRLSGWVRNNADGSVQMELHGNEAPIESMLLWCSKGPTLARVDSIQVEEVVFDADLIIFDIIK